MDHLCRLKNRLPTDAVSTLFDSRALNQVHLATEYPSQFFLHTPQIDERVPGLRTKLDQQIHVAVGAEVLEHSGAEEGQCGNLPATTEGA